jgi:AcrR family transcriptional regulator
MRPTRDRIVTATAELFRRQGYNGTGLKQVTQAAGAPVGSVYHFFPGGKDELAETVILTSGRAYQDLFEAIYAEEGEPVAAMGAFFDGAAAVLAETDYVDACPIGTVALEVASTNDRLRLATHAVFTGWIDAVSARLVPAGVPASEAGELAVTLVAAIEGGFMLSRAARSPEPMRTAGRLMQRLVAAALTTTTDVPG